MTCTLYQFTQVYYTFYIETECNSINISDVFKFDPEYEAKEEKYNCLRKEILDEGSSGSEYESESGEGGDSGEESGEGKQEESINVKYFFSYRLKSR
jgi:pre-mRNA-splicing factor CWC22